MFAFTQRCLRAVVAASITLVSAPLIVCQSPPPQSPLRSNQPHALKQSSGAAPTSPESIAASMWQKVAITCQVEIQGQLKPVTFFDYSHSTAFPIGLMGRLVEYGGAWTKLISVPLTEADRLNGIQYHGMNILGGTARRIYPYPREWSEWRDISHERLPKSLVDYDYNWEHSELVIVVIEKRNNQWLFKGPFRKDSLDLDSFAVNKRSCSTLASTNPKSER
jgi:hypothetical protein